MDPVPTKAEADEDAATALAKDDNDNDQDDDEKDLDRYNPYAGIDPEDPNNTGISAEDFRAMMQKKRAVGIPPLKLLQEKSKQRATVARNETEPDSIRNENADADANVNPDVDADVDVNAMINAEINVVKVVNDDTPVEDPVREEEEGDEEEEEEPLNISPPPHFAEFLRMQKAGVPNPAILQLAQVQGVIENHDCEKELKQFLGMKEEDDCEDENDSNSSNTRKEEEEEPENVPPPPHLAKFLRMKNAGVPNPAILQLARVQGTIENHSYEKELKRLLGLKDDENDVVTSSNPADSKSASRNIQKFQRFLKMQKSGIPREAILRSAKIHGYDCSELEEWLGKMSATSSSSGRDGESESDTHRSALTGDAGGSRDSDANSNSQYTSYVKMRMKGIQIPFVLEAALNQGVTEAEIPGLERILTKVEPTQTTRAIIASYKAPDARIGDAGVGPAGGAGTSKVSEPSPPSVANRWFTPSKDSDSVAFHRTKTSPLSSLVRKMVHTIDKTGRSGSRRQRRGKPPNTATAGANDNANDNSADADDDMVISSKTLYHALGSFRGVQYARDAYNETWATDEAAKVKTSNTGWVRAKRQTFREIAKTIGLALVPGDGGTATIVGLDALVRYIEDRYQEDIAESLSLLRDDQLYDFESLPTLYAPGSRVVAKSIASGGVDMICRVAWNRVKTGTTVTGRQSKHFEVCFEFVVAVGTNLATTAEAVEGIDEFEGRRNIFFKGPDGLTFVPWMAYHEDEQAALLERYQRRGRIYNEVALNHRPGKGHGDDPSSRPTHSYKAYRKGCFFVRRGGFGGSASAAGKAMATGGRIVIDAQGAYDYGHSLNVGYDPMITGIQFKIKEYKLQQSRSASGGGGTNTGNGSRSGKYIVDAAGNSYPSSSSSKRTAAKDDADGGGMVVFDVIPDDYLEMVWPCVIGFSLTAKAWGDCLVDGLEDIEFSEGIFDGLVLPESRKRLIKALVKHTSQLSTSDRADGTTGTSSKYKYNFQDLIRGKGEGSVFLLYGPPGVGKTLTAEAVAEVLQRPLYSLSMGTLGTTADDLEKRLSEILRLSAKWNAIILLDEADSFLEKRSSTSSLERNAMVCVMLQLVEYFSGILFLTSNRMDSLDPAFQTRITLPLQYHDLTKDGRKTIWDNLLSRSGVGVGVEPSGSGGGGIDTAELARFPLNGREIKNAMRLALALAAEEECAPHQALLMETAAMVKHVATSMSEHEQDREHPSVASPSPGTRMDWVQWLVLASLPLLAMVMHRVFLAEHDCPTELGEEVIVGNGASGRGFM
mmetsp:Transcript_19820/g.55231  ORF Transcript_19820/g.55231 Transcript_19820/m.55231 type:complete len:1284 (+) Transcript_19820:178-4029(+)